MKKLWDLKKGFSNLELEGQRWGIIMGVTCLLLLGQFYSIQTKRDQTFWRGVYPPKPFSFVHFNMIQPVLTWTVCDPDETRSNEMSRKNTIKTWTHQTSKEWDGIPLSPDLKRFWDNKWKNIKKSGHYWPHLQTLIITVQLSAKK